MEIDIKALMKLTCYETPPEIPIHASNPNSVYIVGDASGSGFGTCLVIQGNDVTYTEFRKWTKEATKQKSSNFCKSSNLVIRLKNLLQDGKIERGSEVFIVTDNVVTESTFFKGSPKSSSLHYLIVELQRLEMEGELIVQLVWIAGKKMIKISVDGLSRGDFSSGVMAGNRFLKYLPLNERALKRCPSILEHIISCVSDPEARNVSIPEHRFEEVFNLENNDGKCIAHQAAWIWAPSPYLAKIAAEQMCEAKHIFPNMRHIFVCPSLMIGHWRKKLGKLSDTMFTLSSGSCVWPSPM